MTTKTKARLAMGAFLTACLIPSVGMLAVPERTAAANQQLAPPPSLTWEDGSWNLQFLQEVTDYFDDHFAFRQELITADAVLNTALFRLSAEEDVVLGREGWLFYAETLDDVLRTDPLSARQLWASARTLGLVQEYVQDRGGRLLFTVAPNKATLYPQYLPRLGTPLDAQSSLDRLLPLLAEEGVDYVDLVGPLSQETVPLYFRQDSHWNNLGAALAQQTILTAAGKEFEPFWLTRSQSVLRDCLGDLYEMLYPTGTALDWDARYDREFTFTYLRTPRGPDDQRIETENPSKTGSLLLYRDSFGNNLYPFLAEEYRRALFSRSMPWQLSLVDQSEADTVVIELVERNLDYLATRAPIFPAPERLLSGAVPQGTGQGWVAPSEKHPLEGYVRLEGLLSQADSDSPIYIQLGDGLYEATPAGDGWDKGIPFTLYVPQGVPLTSASALCMQRGTLCALPLTNL